MKPIKQTKLYIGPGTCGNCLSACISSLLEIPIDQIPNFVEDREDWQNAVNEFLEPYNMVYIEIPAEVVKDQRLGFHLMAGHTVRSDIVTHAVVAYDGKPQHDPHPSDDYLKTTERYGIFCVIDPSHLVRGPQQYSICQNCRTITETDEPSGSCCSVSTIWSESALRQTLEHHRIKGCSPVFMEQLIECIDKHRQTVDETKHSITYSASM